MISETIYNDKDDDSVGSDDSESQLIDINAIAINNVMTSINSVNSSMIPKQYITIRTTRI